MPVEAPRENSERVEKAYNYILNYLLEDCKLLNMPERFAWPNREKLRVERKEALHEAIRGMFELDSWEGW